MANSVSDTTVDFDLSAEKSVCWIKFWAVIGVFALIVIVTTLWQWVTGPYFTPSPFGPDVMPKGNYIFLRCFEAFSGGLALFWIFWFVVKPWFKNNELSVLFMQISILGIIQ